MIPVRLPNAPERYDRRNEQETRTALERALRPEAPSHNWEAPTGAADRATFDTATVTLPELAEHLKALIDDLTARQVLGA